MKSRRAFLGRAVLLSGAALLLTGHTPYRQWDVYRRAHLLIGCHKADPVTYDLAKDAVAVLAERLPAAKARVARAPHAERLASLLGTGQMEVAILGHEDALAMAAGRERFRPYGALPLRLLAPLTRPAAAGDRLLLAHAELPDRHAWLITSSLIGSPLLPEIQAPSNARAEIGAVVSEDERTAEIPWHPGSRAFLLGEAEPHPQ